MASRDGFFFQVHAHYLAVNTPLSFYFYFLSLQCQAASLRHDDGSYFCRVIRLLSVRVRRGGGFMGSAKIQSGRLRLLHE